MENANFATAFLVYQSIITVGLLIYVIYLGAAFSNYRNMVTRAFEELLKQDQELARRIQQVAGAFTLMDAMFPSSAPSKPAPASKKKSAPDLFNFGKNKNHLSVVDNSNEKDKSPVDKKQEEPTE